MTRAPWKEPEKGPMEKKRERHEQSKYEVGECPECGEERRPPEMDLCPYCHPNTKYTEDESE